MAGGGCGAGAAPPAERPLLSPRDLLLVCCRGRSEPHPLQPQDQRSGPLGVAAAPAGGRRASTAARQHARHPRRRDWVPGRPATASGARASRLQNALARSSSPCVHPPLQRPAHLLGVAQAPPPPGWLAHGCPLTFADSAMTHAFD
eukprot:scaffold79733_cov29-Phaeocystis_antarctica.AAC.1